MSSDKQAALLVSVHLPKTAGTSFVSILESHYGSRLRRDYEDRPLHETSLKRSGRAMSHALRNAISDSQFREVDCIHGHFLPLKYRFLSGDRRVRFVTWLRDPIERLASHYHYWQRTYHPVDAGRLHRRVVEEQWSLERFCLSPELRNTYCRFLWGFPVERFDFLGITEHFDSDIVTLGSRILGTRLAPQAPQNVNATTDSSNAARQRYITDEDFRQTVADYHAKDMALYQRVITSRERRLAAAG